ncbi:MAG: hypothetical protein IT343_10290 [Candidatus Melainabacteria bacterium]|jgi:hypothetical protein|nr:hypothetical protein [Candidatus Melainabacteria bacterium]
MIDSADKLSGIIGRKIVRANSTLRQFAVELSDQACLILDAETDVSGPTINPQVAGSDLFPRDGDAVCAVDWSWIKGAELTDIAVSAQKVRLTLSPQGPVTISVGTWQGKPFLSFMPYQAPTK